MLRSHNREIKPRGLEGDPSAEADGALKGLVCFRAHISRQAGKRRNFKWRVTT
jgi:hypothetical protein